MASAISLTSTATTRPSPACSQSSPSLPKSTPPRYAPSRGRCDRSDWSVCPSTVSQYARRRDEGVADIAAVLVAARRKLFIESGMKRRATAKASAVQRARAKRVAQSRHSRVSRERGHVGEGTPSALFDSFGAGLLARRARQPRGRWNVDDVAGCG
jgi:hypothetical protein